MAEEDAGRDDEGVLQLQGKANGQHQLRKLLKCSLDISIVTRTQHGGRTGPWMCLSKDAMQQVATFRRVHMRGRISLTQWIESLEGDDATKQRQAFAFWHNLDPDTKSIPDVCHMGLVSATRHLNVKLLCYQDDLCLPCGVTALRAEDYLPFSRARELLDSGVHIAHIADFVRLRAMHVLGRGGWCIDCDTLWIRPPVALEYPWRHPQFGHVFASLRAARAARSHLAHFQHWSVNFLKEPMDELFLGMPMFFPAGSPMLADVVATLATAFLETPAGSGVLVGGVSLTRRDHLSYCGIMKALRQAIRQHGLESAVVEPDRFAPLDYLTWKRAQVVERPITTTGEALLEKIFADSTAVHMFWSSSSRGSPAHTQGSTSAAHNRSLWVELVKRWEANRAAEEPVGAGRKRLRVTKLEWPIPEKIVRLLNAGLPGVSDFASFRKRYFLRRFLKRGTYGSVFLAQVAQSDDNEASSVAVKIVQDTAGDLVGREVFVHKYCSDHPNIISLLDGFVSPYCVALVMPLARDTLHSYIIAKRNAQCITYNVAVAILGQLASGLAHVHAKHIIHRDVHSGNVVVYPNEDGNPSLVSVQLIDFGMARRHPADDGTLDKKMSVAVCGGYNSPPEIAFAPSSMCEVAYTSALDVWAFGCVALEVGGNGLPPFANSQGRLGIRDEILDTFGSPPDLLIHKYGWVDVSGRCAVVSIPWGLWIAKKQQVTPRQKKEAPPPLHQFWRKAPSNSRASAM